MGTILENKVSKKSKFSKIFFDKIWSPKIFFIEFFFSERFHHFLTQKNDFACMNFEMFEEVVHTLGMSDDDIF